MPDRDALEIEIFSAEPELETREEDPAQREDLALLPLGKPARDPRFLVAYPCLKQVLAHGQRFPDTEIGGVLLGRIWRSPRGRVTEVTESVPATRTEAGLGHVTFSHGTWQEIYNEMEGCPPELRMVGWYHSHPGFGVFYSEHDRFIQRHFFSGAGQVGIVIDPQRPALAAFECRDGEVEELPGLLVTAERATQGAAHNLLKLMNYD
jgi:proteasome lid subunit RPN8/RPN11